MVLGSEMGSAVCRGGVDRKGLEVVAAEQDLAIALPQSLVLTSVRLDQDFAERDHRGEAGQVTPGDLLKDCLNGWLVTRVRLNEIDQWRGIDAE